MTRIKFDQAALRWYLTNSEDSKALFRKVSEEIRDEARQGAQAVSPNKTDAIVSQLGADSEGIYADVGYARHHPGFFLWWWEVGTVHHGPRPHLRPALRPRL